MYRDFEETESDVNGPPKVLETGTVGGAHWTKGRERGLRQSSGKTGGGEEDVSPEPPCSATLGRVEARVCRPRSIWVVAFVAEVPKEDVVTRVPSHS